MASNTYAVSMKLCSSPSPPVKRFVFEQLDADVREENADRTLPLMADDDERVESARQPGASSTLDFESPLYSHHTPLIETSTKFESGRLLFLRSQSRDFIEPVRVDLSHMGEEGDRFVSWALCFPERRPRHLTLINPPHFSFADVLLLIQVPASLPQSLFQNAMFDPWTKESERRSFLRLVLRNVVSKAGTLVEGVVAVAEECALEVTADPVHGHMLMNGGDKRKVLHSRTDITEYLELESRAQKQRKNFHTSVQIARPGDSSCLVSLRFYDEALKCSRTTELHVDLELDTRSRRRVTFNESTEETTFEEENYENARSTALITERLYPALFLPPRPPK